MQRQRQEELRTSLRTRAAEYSATGRIPIDVERLCSLLGVAIKRTVAVTNHAILVDAKNGLEIRIRQSSSTAQDVLSSLDRFIVAHEIGHLLLAKQFSASPLGRSEYWQHESLCDDFACALLVPDIAIPRQQLRSTTLHEVIQLATDISRAARVPFFCAARRICEENPRFAIFEAVRLDNSVFKIVRTGLPSLQERKRSIPVNSEIGRALDRLRDQQLEVELTSRMFLDDTIPSCTNAAQGIAVLQPSNTIKIAVDRGNAG